MQYTRCTAVYRPVAKLSRKGDLQVGLEFEYEQDAQLWQRDRAAGYITFNRKWKTGTRRQYFTDIIRLSSTAVT